MKFFANTHIGKVRHVNEDSYFAPQDESGFFALVADGMGGHRAGETASRIFVETAKKMLPRKNSHTIGKDDIKAVFAAANKNILHRSRNDVEKRGMGTTASLAVFCKNNALIGHVGDSRVYHFSNNTLTQITRDHSYVQSLVDKGLISKQEALTHPQKNIITRAIGTDSVLKTDIYSVSLGYGDALILCTDGLFGLVNDYEMNKILCEGIETAAPKLIEQALLAGGTDNITVVIAAADGGIL